MIDNYYEDDYLLDSGEDIEKLREEFLDLPTYEEYLESVKENGENSEKSLKESS